ncbi:MAG: hypothetical protein AB7V56_07840 [Candidatus Nitrosocosmicus sp.]|jgi:hypothetical protein|nr:hypothetical protein [Candidatus Nitrosocosmicus sp. SS]MDR4490530.1 hypothetical protein [Candidatus Nitrosocosmicus sp.]
MSEEPLIREDELQQELQDIIYSDLEDARKKSEMLTNLHQIIPITPAKI